MKTLFTVLTLIFCSLLALQTQAQIKTNIKDKIKANIKPSSKIKSKNISTLAGTLGDLTTLKISAGNGNAAILDLEEDKNGNWCVMGFFTDTLRIENEDFVCPKLDDKFQYLKYFYAKYNPKGELLWLKEQQMNNKTGSSSFEKIETDASNNIYILGLYKGTVSFQNQSLTNNAENYKEFFAKYDANGILQWVKGFEQGYYVEASNFVTDATGNSYILSYPAQIAKIDTKGNEIFRKNIPNGHMPGGIALWKDRVIIGTDIIGDNDIYINLKGKKNIVLESIMKVEGSFYNVDALVASLDKNSGEMIWAQTLRGNSGENIKGIGVDNEGNISVAGACGVNATFGLEQPINIPIVSEKQGYTGLTYLLSLSSNGNLNWMKSLLVEEKIDNPEKNLSWFVSLEVDNNGNTFSTRAHCNQSYFWAVYIEGFDKNGNSNFYQTLGLGEDKKNNGFWKSHCGTANVRISLSKYTNRKYLFGEGQYFRNKDLDFSNNLTVDETPYKNASRYFIAQYGDGTQNPDNPIIDPIIDNPVIDNPVTEPVVVINPNTNNATISFVGIPTGKENITPQNLAFEKEVLRLTNIERAKEGLAALVWNDNLARAARYHAADMTKDGYFNHNTHDKVNGKLVEICTTFERIDKFGYGSGENIASGGSTPAATVLQWMNSPGHKENIMRKFTTLGVGFYDGIWVQVFGY